MNIYVDFDDCLCETALHFSGLVKEMFNLDIPYEQIHYFNLQKSFNLTDQQYDEMMIKAHKPEIDTVIFETNVPDGEYLVMLVHDINNNGKLDTTFIGMPKEPVGLSNYDGKGIPGKFKKHKFTVKKDTSIIIPLKKI